jgi:Cu-processing system permease protein
MSAPAGLAPERARDPGARVDPPGELRAALIVARFSLRESLRRRVFVVIGLLTFVFLGLYGLATWQAFKAADEFSTSESGVDTETVVGATLAGLAMFAILFLGTVLAVFLTLGAVRGDAERGLLQPLIVRPLGRRQYLAGRFLAAATVSGAYVLVVYAGAVVVTGTIGDWWPSSPVGAGVRLAGAVVVIAALALLGSIFLSANANGIAVLMVFGAGLLAGLLGSIGEALESGTLQTLANTASWLLPFEALYRDALRVLVAEIPGVTGAIIQLGPLGGSHDAGLLFYPYAVAYLAVVAVVAAFAFGRSDL